MVKLQPDRYRSPGYRQLRRLLKIIIGHGHGIILGLLNDIIGAVGSIGRSSGSQPGRLQHAGDEQQQCERHP
ncbi:hypothetical protein D3C73_1625680 [compost metagenome]